MSQIVNLVLADGQATPVNHTFTVMTPQNGSDPAVWLDKSGGVFAEYPRITALVKVGNDASRSQFRVQLPSLDLDGALKHTVFGKIEVVVPVEATLDEKNDIVAYLTGIVTDAVFSDATILESQPY